MARKLPWAADGSVENVKPSRKRAASTAPQKDIKSSASRPTTPENTPQKFRRTATIRSHSSSPVKPPAQPVPEVEPMRAGVANDDRYIMVEDEFESVARQFTAHLHAAEYDRLKAKARSGPPRVLPSPTSDMQRSTAQGLERKQLLQRQSTALSGLTNGAGESGDEDGHEIDEDSDDNAGDLWRGTSLAGLMDGSENTKTSLIGLQRINGGTRAARGFEKANSQPAGAEKRKRTLAEIFGDDDDRLDDDKHKDKSGREKHHPPRNTIGNDDGHTNTRTKSKISPATSQPSKNKAAQATKRTQHGDDIRSKPALKPDLGSSSSPTPTKDTPRPRRKRFLDFDDDFDSLVPASTSSSATATTRNKAGGSDMTDKGTIIEKAKKGTVKEKPNDRKARLDEVPMFLI